MTIWVLLLGCCFLAPIFLAIRLAGDAHASIAGYVLSVLSGLFFGSGCAATLYKMHKVVARLGERFVSILFLGFIAESFWVVLSGAAASWAVAQLLTRIR